MLAMFVAYGVCELPGLANMNMNLARSDISKYLSMG